MAPLNKGRNYIFNTVLSEKTQRAGRGNNLNPNKTSNMKEREDKDPPLPVI